jgi:hypothetical protein
VCIWTGLPSDVSAVDLATGLAIKLFSSDFFFGLGAVYARRIVLCISCNNEVIALKLKPELFFII